MPLRGDDGGSVRRPPMQYEDGSSGPMTADAYAQRIVNNASGRPVGSGFDPILLLLLQQLEYNANNRPGASSDLQGLFGGGSARQPVGIQYTGSNAPPVPGPTPDATYLGYLKGNR